MANLHGLKRVPLAHSAANMFLNLIAPGTRAVPNPTKAQKQFAQNLPPNLLIALFHYPSTHT
jgi:hypothetical protein